MRSMIFLALIFLLCSCSNDGNGVLNYMGIALSVTIDKVNIGLTDYEIRGYSFAYKTPNSKYA